MSLKSQDGQLGASPVLAGAAPGSMNQQPGTPLRMPPIPKQKHGGGAYSLQRPLPSDPTKKPNAAPHQNANRPKLSVATASNLKMNMMGAHLLGNHQAAEQEAQRTSHHQVGKV